MGAEMTVDHFIPPTNEREAHLPQTPPFSLPTYLNLEGVMVGKQGAGNGRLGGFHCLKTRRGVRIKSTVTNIREGFFTCET
jgi:hypothetical protein